jgi:hypothetical protein
MLNSYRDSVHSQRKRMGGESQHFLKTEDLTTRKSKDEEGSLLPRINSPKSGIESSGMKEFIKNITEKGGSVSD